METTTLKQATHLRFGDRDGVVVVTPEDEDRFAITVEAAIRACQVFQQDALFRFQFKEVLNRLAGWLKARRADVSEAYLTVRDTGLLFLVVRASPSYDESFEDELTDLDIEIAQNPELNLVRLSVLAIPPSSPDSVESFLMPHYLIYQHAE